MKKGNINFDKMIVKTKKNYKRFLIKNRWVLWMTPYFIVLGLLVIYPVIRSIQISFSSIQLPEFTLTFVGIENYISLLKTREFQTVLLNTLFWVVGRTGITFMLGFGSALLLNREFRFRSIFRLLLLLPWAVPPIATANLWGWMLNGDFGIINSTLMVLGLDNWTRIWLANPHTVLPVLLIAEGWRDFPLVSLLILSALQAIPKDVISAAKVDGANKLQIFSNITVPMLEKALLIVILLLIVFALTTFEMIFATTRGGPGYASEIISFSIYKTAFRYFEFEKAAAQGSILFFSSFVIAYFYLRMLWKED